MEEESMSLEEAYEIVGEYLNEADRTLKNYRKSIDDTDIRKKENDIDRYKRHNTRKLMGDYADNLEFARHAKDIRNRKNAYYIDNPEFSDYRDRASLAAKELKSRGVDPRKITSREETKSYNKIGNRKPGSVSAYKPSSKRAKFEIDTFKDR